MTRIGEIPALHARKRGAGVFMLVVFLSSTSLSAGAGGQQDQRESVTFIMGADHDDQNPYYRHAELYFRFDSVEKTEHLVTSCHSLQEVMSYLETHRKRVPWGHINLVSHGNQYQGLRARVVPGGKRANAARIRDAVKTGQLIPLPSAVIDESTSLALHGCGIGQNQELVEAIRHMFSAGNGMPSVSADPYFEYYIADSHAGQSVQKFLADCFMVSYKMGYKPALRSLVRAFGKKYPGDDVNWNTALSATEATLPGEVFHYAFDVPMKWVFQFSHEDSIPKLDTRSSQLWWAKNHPQISADLGRLAIRPEEVNWWFRNIQIEGDDGKMQPALWIKGYSTVLCVLRLRHPE